jgi:predicted solute-binding protein
VIDAKAKTNFEKLFLGATLMAAVDRRSPPERAVAELFFRDMHYGDEELARLSSSPAQQLAAAYCGLEAFFALLLYLQLDKFSRRAFKEFVDKQFQPHGLEKVPPKVHRKFMTAARRRLAEMGL